MELRFLLRQEFWPRVFAKSSGRRGGACQVQVETKDVEVALPEVDVGKPDEAEAFIHGPGRLHHPGRVQHEAVLADRAGAFDAETGQFRADALAAVGVVDGKQ